MKNIVYRDAYLEHIGVNYGFKEYAKNKDQSHHYRVQQAIKELKNTGNILVYFKKNNRKPLRLIYSKLISYKFKNKEVNNG